MDIFERCEGVALTGRADKGASSEPLENPFPLSAHSICSFDLAFSSSKTQFSRSFDHFVGHPPIVFDPCSSGTVAIKTLLLFVLSSALKSSCETVRKIKIF